MANTAYNRKLKELLYRGAGIGVEVDSLVNKLSKTSLITAVSALKSSAQVVNSLQPQIDPNQVAPNLFEGLDKATSGASDQIALFREDLNAAGYPGDALNDRLADLLEWVNANATYPA